MNLQYCTMIDNEMERVNVKYLVSMLRVGCQF